MQFDRTNEESIQSWKGIELGQVEKSNYFFTIFKAFCIKWNFWLEKGKRIGIISIKAPESKTDWVAKGPTSGLGPPNFES